METKVVPSEADYQLNNLPNTAEEKVEAKEEAPEEHGEKEWSNPIEFLMTCIGKHLFKVFSLNLMIIG